MKFSSKDFTAMKWPAIVLVIALVASYAMLEYTSQQRLQSSKRYQNDQAALRDAQTRFQRSGDERQTVLHYLQTYRQLEKLGFVGQEQRLNWVEGLRAANEKAGLFGVDYQIGAQESFPYLAKGDPLGERVRRSQMKVALGLVHEEDLMRFFGALAAQRPGIYTLNGCSLDRVTKDSAPAARQRNLTASCELSWMTIDPGKAAK
jgi:hypothetical protein